MINFTEYFKEERDVWARCLVPGQVVISFRDSTGRSRGVTIPYGKDPVNLSATATFNDIKDSGSVRSLFSAGALMLMTVEEVETYFEEKAKRRGLASADEARAQAAERYNKIYSRQKIGHDLSRPPASASVFDTEDGEKYDGVIRVEDTITPRVMHLCRQVASDLPDNNRMPASELLDELEAVEGTLTLDDLEYIRANGTYHSVKKWADVRSRAKIEADTGGGIEDDIPAERVKLP
jgi:hypothetical protein